MRAQRATLEGTSLRIRVMLGGVTDEPSAMQHTRMLSEARVVCAGAAVAFRKRRDKSIPRRIMGPIIGCAVPSDVAVGGRISVGSRLQGGWA